MIPDLTTREKRVVIVTAAVTFTLGLWFGVWSVPTQALDVPMNYEGSGDPTAAYTPAPNWLPFISLFTLGGAAFYVYGSLNESTEESEESEDESEASAVTDGGISP